MDVRDGHAGGSKWDGSGCDHGTVPGLPSRGRGRSMTQSLNLATVSEICFDPYVLWQYLARLRGVRVCMCAI